MNKDKKQAQVFHYNLYGKRAEKYNFLLNNNLQSVQWQELKFEDDNYFFVPKNFDLKDEYEKGFKVDELLPVNTSGVKTHDDTNLVNFVSFSENNQLYSYRPFDIRYINYDLKKVKRHRNGVMKHFIKGENIGLVISRQCVSDWRYVFINGGIADVNFIATAGAFGGGNISPLYLYPETSKLFEDAKRKPNLNETIISEIAQRIGMQFVAESNVETRLIASLQNETFAPINVLDYIYAVLHSPAYREKYKEFLKIDFPRVPYPENAEQFCALAELGGKLRCLHLMEGVEPQQGMADFPIAGSSEVEKPQYSPPLALTERSRSERAGGGRVYINDTQYFDHVPPEAWSFYIGGYQPAQKWLKDRKGRTLEYEDIRHYQKIIRVLKETEEIMQTIDKQYK